MAQPNLSASRASSSPFQRPNGSAVARSQAASVWSSFCSSSSSFASESANQSRWPSARAAFVAEAGEPANVVGDPRPDGLRRLPRLATLGGVVALAEDALDLVVVEPRRGRRRGVARTAPRRRPQAR